MVKDDKVWNVKDFGNWFKGTVATGATAETVYLATNVAKPLSGATFGGAMVAGLTGAVVGGAVISAYQDARDRQKRIDRRFAKIKAKGWHSR